MTPYGVIRTERVNFDNIEKEHASHNLSIAYFF